MTDMTNETVLTKEHVEQIIDERDKRLTEHLLEMFKAELGPLRTLIDAKMSRAEVNEQLRPIQQQLDEVRNALVQTNLMNAEIKSALNILTNIHGDRIDTSNKRIDEIRIDVDLNASALAGMSESFTLIRRDLYGGDGNTQGIQQVMTAFGLQLTRMAENQNLAINSAIQPLTERIGSLETAFGVIEKFVNERKRIEAAALGVGKKAWTWLTGRSPTTRRVVVVVAGVVFMGWLHGQPLGQILEAIVQRLLGLP